MHIPERATIQISIDDEGNLQLEDIKLFKNGTPSSATQEAVYDWLDAASDYVDVETYKSESELDFDEDEEDEFEDEEDVAF